MMTKNRDFWPDDTYKEYRVPDPNAKLLPCGTRVNLVATITSTRYNVFYPECYVDFEDPRGRGQWVLQSILDVQPDTDVLPCPFCKRTPNIEPDVSCGFEIICRGGDDHQPIKLWGITKGDVIQSWNMRNGAKPMLVYKAPTDATAADVLIWLGILAPKFPCRIDFGSTDVWECESQEQFDDYVAGFEVGLEANDDTEQ